MNRSCEWKHDSDLPFYSWAAVDQRVRQSGPLASPRNCTCRYNGIKQQTTQRALLNTTRPSTRQLIKIGDEEHSIIDIIKPTPWISLVSECRCGDETIWFKRRSGMSSYQNTLFVVYELFNLYIGQDCRHCHWQRNTAMSWIPSFESLGCSLCGLGSTLSWTTLIKERPSTYPPCVCSFQWKALRLGSRIFRLFPWPVRSEVG